MSSFFSKSRNFSFTWLAALLLSVPALSLAQQVAIIEHPVPTDADGITAGPDGALWFTDGSGNKIGRITTAGVISEYPLPTAYSEPDGITAGPDGAVWFTEYSGNKIGRISTIGVITQYPLPAAGSLPSRITAGPDGALWFTESYHNRIGRITTAGVITEYPLPTGSQPVGITAGPDGALWFTEFDKIGRITTGGTVTEYPVPNAHTHDGITAGPDGALWFTDFDKIGRITTAGVITEYPLPTASSSLIGITSGPDGALWFTEYGNGIGRITTAGVITEYPIPTAIAFPDRITPGPDGALWFTESVTESGDRIGQVVFQTAILTAKPDTGAPGTSVTRTGSGFAPGESVNFFANSTGTNLLGTVSADASGSFGVTSRVHEAPYGANNSVVAVGQTSGKLAVAHFSVTSRLIIDPGTGTPGSAMSAHGFGFGQGEQVNVYWNNPRTFLGSSVANDHGTFSQDTALTFNIPAGAPPGVNGVFGMGSVTGAIGKGYVNVQ